jgi:outer membrane PBP1 activator LpoA protein
VWLLMLALWGCAEQPQKKVAQPEEPRPQKEQAAKPQGTSLQLPASSYGAVFASAEQSLSRFDWMQASVELQQIPRDGLSRDDSAYMDYLQARISYVRGDQRQALQYLSSADSPGLDPALRYRILSFRHHILDIQGDTLAAAQLADLILRSAPEDTAAAWKRTVWRELELTSTEELASAQSSATDPQWRGWLELALVERSSANSASQLSQWRSAHPGHPAANPLPGGLDFLVNNGPRQGKVALLLPLSGELAPAGKAVLDGYLAAYYADRATGGPANELLVLDLDQSPTTTGAYEEAVRQGASLVVGPLGKESLAELATQLERPVPILALNRIDQILPASGSALVQLSLAPEDEAEGLAELAYGSGARRAVIISPTGDWGSKVDAALRARWTALGGTVASSATYGQYEEYSSSVKSTLSLDASEQRGRELQDALDVEIEFTPRRRQDADIIFLLGRTSTEARSIKPLLAFHYAGDLPVYALSSIYSGVPDERNQDLDGIHLVDMPWVLGASPALRTTLASSGNDESYTRLNALGADAFLVQSGFGRLQSGADALFRGNTGLLTMEPDLSIHRELSAATFDAGALKAQ